MKQSTIIKILLFLVVMGLISGMTGCTEQGEIKSSPIEFIEIHGKTYKLMSIVPCDNCNAIWIMYPKDSLDSQPTVLNWNESTGAGKTRRTVNKTLIKVD